jgi:hypothetical protein
MKKAKPSRITGMPVKKDETEALMIVEALG